MDEAAFGRRAGLSGRREPLWAQDVCVQNTKSCINHVLGL